MLTCLCIPKAVSVTDRGCHDKVIIYIYRDFFFTRRLVKVLPIPLTYHGNHHHTAYGYHPVSCDQSMLVTRWQQIPIKQTQPAPLKSFTTVLDTDEMWNVWNWFTGKT